MVLKSCVFLLNPEFLKTSTLLYLKSHFVKVNVIFFFLGCCNIKKFFSGLYISLDFLTFLGVRYTPRPKTTLYSTQNWKMRWLNLCMWLKSCMQGLYLLLAEPFKIIFSRYWLTNSFQKSFRVEWYHVTVGMLIL